MGKPFFSWYSTGCNYHDENQDKFKRAYQLYNGNPCQVCVYKNTCKKLSDKKSWLAGEIYIAPSTEVKTNAEIAKELGISKRQVAKMRKRGEL